jgi:tRNA G18 (ribose-2'-O)-methylase SpoU
MRKLRHEEIPRASRAELSALPLHPITVIVDGVRSLYNVGALFRTADAARLERLILTGITGTPEHRGLHKTALGSQESVPWSQEPDAIAVARRLRASGYTLAVLEITDAPMPTSHLRMDHFPLALVVGNEVDGVQDDLVALADLALEIPQFGVKQSLNVAVAFGIAVFDLVRHYRALCADTTSYPSVASLPASVP